MLTTRVHEGIRLPQTDLLTEAGLAAPLDMCQTIQTTLMSQPERTPLIMSFRVTPSSRPYLPGRRHVSSNQAPSPIRVVYTGSPEPYPHARHLSESVRTEDRMHTGLARRAQASELHGEHSVRWTSKQLADHEAILLDSALLACPRGHTSNAGTDNRPHSSDLDIGRSGGGT